MKPPKDIYSPDEVDICDHAVIEASAGTGKTYTIEKLVLRLLMDGVKINEILLVTFTEKATGELQERIRAAIVSELESLSEPPVELSTALSSFSEANIHTIHGFCQKVLREFAFENGCAFKLEHTGDKEIYAKILNRMKRKWAFDSSVQPLLEEYYDPKKTDGIIIELAEKVQKGDGLQKSDDDEAWQEFIIQSSKELKEKVIEYKSSKSLISYQDMIANVCRAFQGEGGSRLSKTLQNKYSVGLIDEFQDTDNEQWSIFKSIFIENSSETGNRLFVVGDPKQAIYSFRGADINAYLKARKEMLEDNAGYYNLPVNRRSMPDLIQGVNSLVSSPQWFGAGGDDDWSINFKAVQYQDESARLESNGPLLHKDESGDPSLNFIEPSASLGSKITVGPLRGDLAKTIASKILNLKGRMTFTVKGVKRSLLYKDICILVRGFNEFQKIEEELRLKNIPFTYYKKKGIYQSKAAVNYIFMFEALAKPGDNKLLRKALVSDFFDLAPEQIDSFEGLPADHSLKELWYKCLRLAESSSWGLLFKALLHESGILYRCSENKDEHSTAAYEQLANEYIKFAVDENLNTAGLAGKINFLYRSKDSGDENLHEKETESDAVQVMTQHASKGLEFPVVFIFGGFSAYSLKDVERYYDVGQEKNIYTLSKAKETVAQLIKDKAIEEDKRLYYVAATRAVFKLYLLNVDPDRLSRKNQASLYKLIYPSIQDCEIVKPLRNEQELSGGTAVEAEDGSDFKNLELPVKAASSCRRRKVGIYSFSSLTALESDSHKTYFNEINLSAERDDDSTVNDDVEDSDHLILPRGAQTGELLHTVLELINYSEIQKMKSPYEILENESCLECIQSCMEKFPVGEKRLFKNGVEIDNYQKALCRMVYNTLMTPITELGGLRFSDIASEDRRHEMEFYMPVSNGLAYLNGIIDLLFRVRSNGKDVYYVLDWKTTSVYTSYSKDDIAESMQEKNYILQYQLYSYAVLEWFKSFAGPEATLGGSLYIYTRGMNTQKPEQGIYFDAFEDESSQYKDRVVQLVDRAVSGGA